jgi:glutaredoxin
MSIKIYTKSNCSFCVQAKNWLNRNNLGYEEVSLDDPVLLEQFKNENPGLRTVPQIFLTENGLTTRIGGYTDLISSNLINKTQLLEE